MAMPYDPRDAEPEERKPIVLDDEECLVIARAWLALRDRRGPIGIVTEPETVGWNASRGGNVGWGGTEVEAVADLIRIENENADAMEAEDERSRQHQAEYESDRRKGVS